ncbi:hypothetical protein VNO80_07712 [Phaseolus coccineus]|uniref:Uncharacterized protein n=1 Tax=Phaseolus coccineus TaxID=3886 RepID=A0AAN9RJV4_PHACN
MAEASFFSTNIPPGRRQLVTRKVWNPKVQQVPTVTVVKRGQSSYAQVVKNGDACASQEEAVLDAKTPFFNVTPEFPKWLEGSFVRSLSKVSDIQVSLEEERGAKSFQDGCFHCRRWGGDSTRDFEAQMDGSVGVDFFDSDGSEFGDGGSVQGGEETSVQFPKVREGNIKGGACFGIYYSNRNFNAGIGTSSGNNLLSRNSNNSLESNDDAWKRKELGAVAIKVMSKGLVGPGGDVAHKEEWPEDSICVGPILAQSREATWLRESLGLGPSPDAADLAWDAVRVCLRDVTLDDAIPVVVDDPSSVVIPFSVDDLSACGALLDANLVASVVNAVTVGPNDDGAALHGGSQGGVSTGGGDSLGAIQGLRFLVASTVREEVEEEAVVGVRCRAVVDGGAVVVEDLQNCAAVVGGCLTGGDQCGGGKDLTEKVGGRCSKDRGGWSGLRECRRFLELIARCFYQESWPAVLVWLDLSSNLFGVKFSPRRLEGSLSQHLQRR